MIEWERLRNETLKNYELFIEFRESQAPRDIRGIAAAHDLGYETTAAIADKWRWAHRAQKYDSYLATRLKSPGAAIKSRKKSHQYTFSDCTDSIVSLLGRINEKVRVGDDDLDDCKLDELIKHLNNFSKTVAESRKTIDLITRNEDETAGQSGEGIAGQIHSDEVATAIAGQLLRRLDEINN